MPEIAESENVRPIGSSVVQDLPNHRTTEPPNDRTLVEPVGQAARLPVVGTSR